MSPGTRPLGVPVPAAVRTGPGGRPRAVDGHAVEAVRESWLVEDRWWTERPLRRRYWEVVTASGRDLVVFRELGAHPSPDSSAARAGEDGWYRQR